MGLDILRLVAGLVILIVAADRLVVSAVRIARIANISVIIIGAVIVGFGTSVPEFVVTGLASTQGNVSLGMSNVVASNTANVGLVLGLAAAITAVATARSVVRREGFLMLASVTALAAVLAGGYASRTEGIALTVGMALAIYLLIRWSRGEGDSPSEAFEGMDDDEGDPDRFWVEALYGLAALVATIVAGQQLLLGVENIGEELGFSILVMGAITGVGTSLPELSAALAGARRGHSDLVLGNVLGSNIFNSLGVAGLAAILGPGEIHGVPPLLLGIMVGVAAFAGIIGYTRQRISRVEGVLLLGVFAAYIAASL